MSRSMTFARRYQQHLFAILLSLSLLTGCGPATVVVEGRFPSPLIEPLPLKLGVWYGPDFAQHEFFDESTTRGQSSWVVKTGQAQILMWNSLLAGVFDEVVHLKSAPVPGQSIPGVDGILVPHVSQLQYTIPKHTQVKVYEIWMLYRFELLTPDAQPVAEWDMSSYGKTPTAFLQSDQEAVNLAAVMALRDAGANFATTFTRIAPIQAWLQAQNVPAPGSSP